MRARTVPATGGAFLAILTVDFLLHAVVLSPWWRATGSYWRPPAELFALIPFAYAAYALCAVGLCWLLVALRGERPGLRFAAGVGAAAGAFLGAVSVLASYSVLAMPPGALLVFPLSFAVALGAGGAACALVLSAARPWRRLAVLAAGCLLLCALGVVVQNLVLPTPADHRVARGA